jgi:hypothetical protein
MDKSAAKGMALAERHDEQILLAGRSAILDIITNCIVDNNTPKSVQRKMSTQAPPMRQGLVPVDIRNSACAVSRHWQ